MIINGKERAFRLTVGAAAEIAKLCPGGDMGRLGEILGGDNTAQSIDTTARMAVAMNRGFLMSEDPEADANDVLTIREIMAMGMEDFNRLQDEVLTAFEDDKKTEVEIVAKKNEEADVEADR